MDDSKREEIGDLLRRLVDTAVEMKDRVEAAEEKLDKAIKAIEKMRTASDGMMLHIARTTLAELKGQSDG